jgi:hypothetical protein
MLISNEEYDRLMVIASDTDAAYYTGVVPMSLTGEVRDRIEPDSVLYMACGEEGLIYIDADMKPHPFDSPPNHIGTPPPNAY